jgi:opacity protein-like surface antigen
MNYRAIILVAASVATLALGAGQAFAQDFGPYVSIGVGSTTVEQTDGGLSPKGTAVDVRLGNVFFDYDGWSVAAEAGAAYSNASASEQGTFCIDFDCNDEGIWTDEETSKWSGSLGLRVSRPVGPVVVSGIAGVRVAEFTRTSHYDNAGFFPDETYENTAFAFGGYYGFGLDYPVNDRWSVGIEWQHSDLVQTKWEGSYGGDERGFTEETWKAGFRRKF